MKKIMFVFMVLLIAAIIVMAGCKKSNNPSGPSVINTKTVTQTCTVAGTATVTFTASPSVTLTGTVTPTITPMETTTPDTGGNDTVKGNVTYPDAPDKYLMYVVFDTDTIPANGNEIVTIVRELEDKNITAYNGVVPDAIYYLYACVDLDQSGWASGPTGNDYFGYYDGKGSPLVPADDPNAKVLPATLTTFDFELGVFPTFTATSTGTETYTCSPTFTPTFTVTKTATPTVTMTATHIMPPDAYEPDNTFTFANTLNEGAGAVQPHALHSASDNDWVKFSLVIGNRYRIYTQNTGAAITDPRLRLYSTNGATLLASTNEVNGYIEFISTGTGTYYGRFSDASGNNGYDATYQIGLLLVQAAPSTPVDFDVAIDQPGRTFNVGGLGTWLGQTFITHDTVDAVESSLLLDNQYAIFETSVFVPSGKMGHVTFYYKVSSEASKDKLNIYLNSVLQYSYSGDVDWTFCLVSLTPNMTNVVRVEYIKDASGSAGYDKAWVDEMNVSVY